MYIDILSIIGVILISAVWIYFLCLYIKLIKLSKGIQRVLESKKNER